jgi:hypothetical protein
VNHRQGTVLEPAQLRQGKYAAASGHVHNGVGATEEQRPGI